MQTIDFDLDKFIRTSDRVDLSEVEWERASDPPPTPAEARRLRYMMDIETDTVIFLRSSGTERLSAGCSARPGSPSCPITNR